jgi:hypothetical protein
MYNKKKGALLIQSAFTGAVYKDQWTLACALIVSTTFDWHFAQIFEPKNY